MDGIWHDLVRECLHEIMSKYGDRPVAGAPFSQALRHKAMAHDLDFPPAPYKSFRLFIEQFRDILFVHRPPGRDILIVPAGRADLLSVELANSNANRVREDLFDALTQIPKRSNTSPYYLPESDEVLWFDQDTPKPQGSVPFAKATFEQEINDRKQFIDATELHLSHTAKSILSIALTSPSPLGAFSNAVTSLDLRPAWHRFRMSAVLTRLQRWSAENKIEWKSAWISESTVKTTEQSPAEQVPAVTAQMLGSVFGRNFFTALANVVTDEDLARITIPLDIVAKAWNANN